MHPSKILTLLTLATLATGCGKKTGDAGKGAGAGGNPGVVKIVSSLPRTGSANAQTTTMVNGIKMAIEEAGGKVGNFQLIYEDWDDASAKKGDWDPEVEAANANKAVNDPDVLFYLGTYNSGAAKIAMPVLNKASVVMLSPANTYTGLTKPGMGEPNEPGVYRPTGKVNYFRVVPADDIQGKAAAEWIQKLGGARHLDRGQRRHRPQGPGVPVADDQDQGLESRLGLLRRHDAEQRGPDRQGHGRGRSDGQADDS
jgi:branched-chain amino acid transport system substrate-binding protein